MLYCVTTLVVVRCSWYWYIW